MTARARIAATLGLLVTQVAVAAFGGGFAQSTPDAAEPTSRSPHLRGQQEEVAVNLTLDIPGRRQWDCNLAGIGCCTAPRQSRQDAYAAFMDSCLDSPRPEAGPSGHDETLTVADCLCGENQCELASLCPSKHDTPVNGSGGSCASRRNTQADLGAEPPIPDCSGYCGETSVQETLLYWGTYISQGQVRRLNYLYKEPVATHRQEQEILINGLGVDGFFKKNDIEQAMQRLGFRVFPWYYNGTSAVCRADPPCKCNDGGEGSFSEFQDWVTCHLKAGLPVVVGVVVHHGNDETYDHIVTAFGIQGDKLLVNDHYSNKPQVLEMRPVRNGEECSRRGHWICLSRQGFGVAVSQPKLPAWAAAGARLAIAKCSGPEWLCGLAQKDGLGGAYWREPNYRVGGIGPASFELAAAPVGDLPANPVAVKHTFKSAEAFARGDPPSVECFETAGGQVGAVQSDAIAFVHFCSRSRMREAGCRPPTGGDDLPPAITV